MTTVGYGDRYPTTVGRLAAAGLMIGGIALLGVVTATLASWLIEQVAETPDRREVCRPHRQAFQDAIRVRCRPPRWPT
jgi:hypothetical protein